MVKNINDFKNAIVEMIKYDELSNEASDKLLNNPLDTDAEKDFDTYYSKYWDNWMKAVQLLKAMINCDDATAKKMIATKRDEIISLVSRLA